MKPVSRIYAVLVALTLVGLLAWSVADWYQLRLKAEDQGRVALRTAAGLLSDLSAHQRPLDAATLSAVFARSPGADPRWKVVVLSSDRGTEYYRGPRPAVPVDAAVPHWAPRALAEVAVSLPVFRAAADPMALSGIYEFYGRSEVFSLLKACGVTLVVLLVVTALMVLVQAQRREPAPSPQATPEPERPQPVTPHTPAETVGTIDVDEYWFDDNLTLEDLPPLQTPTSSPQDTSEVAPTRVAEGAPSLFSPATGLGWAEFLSTRLDYELERATADGVDLAVVLLTAETPDRAAWGQAVRKAFPSVDLDFEQPDGAAVVLRNRSLEDALSSARAFVDAQSALGLTVHAGVASRSGRSLVSDVLLSEAGSAKRRAKSGTVRVLGLKVDPERWRAHVASA